MSAKKPLQKLILLVSAVSFLGSTGYALAQMFSSGFEQAEKTAAEGASVEQQLQAQARGYELVLQREPENPMALEGLVKTRLQMNNLEGAVEPLEKLVEMQPEQTEYKILLAEIQQQVEEGSEGDR